MLRKRFLFLTRGDRIAAVMNEHEGVFRNFSKITPAIDAREAGALVNFEDGHTETSLAVQLVDPRLAYLVIGAVVGMTFVLFLALGILMTAFEDPEDLLLFPLFIFFSLVVFWAGFCLLWELGKNGVLLFTGEVSERQRWEERVGVLLAYLAPGRFRAVPRQRWTSVARRVGILLAVGGVAVTVLALW